MIETPSWGDGARSRYPGARARAVRRADVGWGDAAEIRAPAGSIIAITSVDGAAAAWITAIGDADRSFAIDALELPGGAARRIDPRAFDARRMAAVAETRGATLADARAAEIFGADGAPGDMVLTRAARDVALFVIAPVVGDFVGRGGGGRFVIEIKPPDGADLAPALPEPLGKVRDEWRVRRGSAWAYELKAGQFVQIIDVEGRQCSDFMALGARALDAGVERLIDSTVTRTLARGAYPLPGLHDKFYDQEMTPLLSVQRDTVGRHDTFALACTARMYEDRGFPGHLNCSDNISDAFSPYGIARRRAWPAINFFFNSWIDPADNVLASDEAWSQPGDYVAMRALTDLVCVSTACPDDIDPINGWNPTDIHVRIYEADASISRAVAWRAHPEEAARLTQESPFHPRLSALTSSFHPVRDQWTAARFDATGAVEEYWACRTAATLQDMSGLVKFDVVGPDAEELLQHCLTRNVAKLAQFRGTYALLCDARGVVLDDGTLFRLEPSAFRWCCGAEDSGLHLREQAERLGLRVAVRSLGRRLPNLALQGPRSRDILREIVYTDPSRPALDAVKWFGFTIARLRDRDGPAFMLSRTGFTGELGYELFCDAADALALWDAVMAAGAAHGITPMGSEALGLLRIEAGLMTAGAEFGPDCDAYEAGLGFAVDLKKPDFIGRAALERNAAAPRRALVGLAFPSREPPRRGDGVFIGREQVGVVTSACASPQLGHAIAMARVAIETSAEGTELEIGQLDGRMKRLPCVVTSVPFLDPRREKPRA